jgi:uncharacterized membrane protein YccC
MAETVSMPPRVHTAKDLALRRGVRAAIALPGVLAVVDAVTGNETAALFAAFAAFALLAMADFGGPPRARAVAYVTATAIGGVLVAVGTLVSQEPVLAAVVALIVGFTVMQVAAFGGAWATGMFATTLAFVLSATFGGPASDIPTRLWGWGVGGLVATVMALVLWPAFERPALWRLLAEALRSAATLVRADGAPDERAKAVAAVRQLRQAYAAAPYRPAGPAVRDRAFVALMEGVERLVALEPSVGGPLDEPGARLRAASASVLDASAACVIDLDAPEPDLGAIDTARSEHLASMTTWAGEQLRGGTPAQDVLKGLEGAWWSRVVSFLAISLAADAVIGRGGHALDDDLATTLQTPVEDTGDVRSRFTRVLRVNLDVGSIRFRNAVRTAVALGLAILIAGLLSLDHAFWVGLAVLSVLRSNALATGRTAVQAVGGTVAGFLIVLVFFGIFDAGTTAEWIALPVASFLAAYAPSAISFVVGQASFTVAIVLLFDVIDPEGWRTGVVRVEDIAIGAAVSLVVGLLFWPRGAVGMLRRVLGAHLRADADYLDVSMRALAGEPADDQGACHARALDASRRVADAYDDLLATPGTLPPGHESWGAIAGAARRVQAASDLLVGQRKLGFVVQPLPDAARLLRAESDGLGRALRSGADAVEHAGDAEAIEPEPATERRAAEAEALRSWGGRDDSVVNAAIGVVWTSEVLHATDLAVRDAAMAIAAVNPEP